MSNPRLLRSKAEQPMMSHADRGVKSAPEEPHILARQMIGHLLAMGRPFGLLLLDPRNAPVFAGEIAIEIFKPERS
jgi:hypothetical protein